MVKDNLSRFATLATRARNSSTGKDRSVFTYGGSLSAVAVLTVVEGVAVVDCGAVLTVEGGGVLALLEGELLFIDFRRATFLLSGFSHANTSTSIDRNWSPDTHEPQSSVTTTHQFKCKKQIGTQRWRCIPIGTVRNRYEQIDTDRHK